MNLGHRTFGHSSVRLTHFRPDIGDEADKIVWDKCRMVSHVETDPRHRGKGHATHMMRKVCQQADAVGLSLVLEPKPYDDEPMDRNALESFYTRLGFMRIQDDPVLMVRIARNG